MYQHLSLKLPWVSIDVSRAWRRRPSTNPSLKKETLKEAEKWPMEIWSRWIWDSEHRWIFLKPTGLLLPMVRDEWWEVSTLEVGRVLSLGWRHVAIVLRIHYNFYTSFLRYQGSNNKLQCQGRSVTRSCFIPVAPWIKTCHSFVQSFPASVRMASFDSTHYLLEKCFPYCQRFWKYTL